MYDFCFTLPYAGLLALGGVTGFLTKGSIPSLAGGLGSAAVLAVCAQISLAKYHQGRLCKPATATSLVVTSALTIMMSARWRRTRKFMPPGIIAVTSAAMSLFLLWNLLCMRPPIKEAKR
ncbi:hypothetical protein WJX73_006423 [Symbiochloris irregularis]|uniref:Transmembrane protein 14 n=1 Tax=Symbiochloris irregularis TaxID=706552 RepID=A0AAW1NL08_9CHLO